MNELDFKSLWEKEKPIYSKWGQFVTEKIKKNLEEDGLDLKIFLKIPPVYRLKDDKSLIDKAFFRTEKKYTDPYNQIEDKVGIRFVVLLIDDIQKICDVIENSQLWDYDPCKHFNEDKIKEPLLFTYQSVHYILRPKKEFTIDGDPIGKNTPCEVQIRTLLQHAHAELTHDAIYKAKKVIQPSVHRTVAKSMALIETTDDFFSKVTKELNLGLLEEFSIIKKLDSIYTSLTGLTPDFQKSSMIIWDEYENLIDENLINKIGEFVNKKKVYSEVIKEKYHLNSIYRQSTILFIYWMLSKKRGLIISTWPLDLKVLKNISSEIGISTWDGD